MTNHPEQRDMNHFPALKVALTHDWLTGMRGGEKVLHAICTRFPEAPLWTLLHIPGSTSALIENRAIHTSLLQYLPSSFTKYRNYLPFFPLLAELNKVRDADLVISTSHAVAKAMVKRSYARKPFHICYIHTPMRYAWDRFDEYFGPARVGHFASRFIFKPLIKLLRIYDTKTSGRVDLFLANSRYVAARVQTAYGRHAEVLPPPVDTDRFSAYDRSPEDWYLVVSAMVPYKRIDHAIRACAQRNRKLRIVGKGPELESLQRLAAHLGSDVEFVGCADDEELCQMYSHARALVFPGIEDFGIVPVEAIACGCPVIALGIGGVLDSMTERTAVLYTEESSEGLADAIALFEHDEKRFIESELRNQASLFSTARFLEGLEGALRRVYDIERNTMQIGLITPSLNPE